MSFNFFDTTEQAPPSLMVTGGRPKCTFRRNQNRMLSTHLAPTVSISTISTSNVLRASATPSSGCPGYHPVCVVFSEAPSPTVWTTVRQHSGEIKLLFEDFLSNCRASLSVLASDIGDKVVAVIVILMIIILMVLVLVALAVATGMIFLIVLVSLLVL